MVRVNCHVHSSESDGNLSPREVVERAVEEGVDVICFTDHFRVPKDVHDFEDEERHLDSYYEELNLLKREFQDKVEVLVGLELDWIGGYEDWFVGEIRDRNYDFILGSVHWLRDATGRWNRPHFPVGELERFDSERGFVEMYLDEVEKMVEFGVVDCVAHLDVFRKRFESPRILLEDWYRERVSKLLDLMKKKGIALELNCAGWVVLDEQFPQKWILKMAVEKGIGISVGNDFHKLKFGRLDEGIDRAFEVLREVGAKEVLVFKNREVCKLKI
ncbi:histidinol-phosphatase HisJ family protein [Methanococcoides sp. SA1]|nr:histidinol-phosphatase HisJ family protein [Methanococcoides sp. SA1]